MVVFFCVREGVSAWEYFFIGCATVHTVVEERCDLWQKSDYIGYRQFYNLLVRCENGALLQNETFYPFHPDWRRRARTPYLLFDPEMTRLNLGEPLHVATWRSGEATETWLTGKRVTELKKHLIDMRGIRRGLRTRSRFRPHTKLNLCSWSSTAPTLDALRNTLFELAE